LARGVTNRAVARLHIGFSQAASGIAVAQAESLADGSGADLITGIAVDQLSGLEHRLTSFANRSQQFACCDRGWHYERQISLRGRHGRVGGIAGLPAVAPCGRREQGGRAS